MVAREEIVAVLERLGIKNADNAFVERVIELNEEALRRSGSLPDHLGRDLLPAAIFSVPVA